LGVIYRDQGEFERAGAAYASAIRVNSAYALAYFNLGVLNDLYRQQPELALDYYQQYRALLPEGVEDPEVDRWIADLQRRTGTAQNDGDRT
jgi:tetratricopeptide (TPR) repeat protein